MHLVRHWLKGYGVQNWSALPHEKTPRRTDEGLSSRFGRPVTTHTGELYSMNASNEFLASVHGKSALQLLEAQVFPDWWSFVPVAGKATYIREWTTKPMQRMDCIVAYKTNNAYNGLGVVTGAFSGGLIALDIDGHNADQRYREVAGDEYEPFGEESTLSWTSGKPGRRQVLYRVPAELVNELAHVKTLIRRMEDGIWYLGQGDTNRPAGGSAADGQPYEELVLRFNHCQSVVPGSIHPETKQPYKFLQYLEVALAPAWLLEVLRGVRRPLQWLTDEQQKALDAELGETAVPSRQIRGWFFKEEVQRLLMPRLEELVFRHEAFDAYGWKTREGSNPQRMSGCPWHGGRSGTSFQFSTLSGCWDCKACGVGGDVLDFIHKVRQKDRHAGKPQGPDLEVYVAEIATKLGFDYPACAKAVEVTTREQPVKRLTGHEFFRVAEKIDDEFENAELGDYHLMELVRDAGLSNVYRSGPQVRAALERFKLHEEQIADDPQWQIKVRGEREYLIPDFMSKPSSIMLHARGGMGKTRLAVLISKIVGQKQPMKIRGLTVEPTTSGNVLFIGNDMSMTDYAEYFDQQGIDSAGLDTWMRFKPHWQQSQYKVLVRWIKELKPVLVVVDSLTSVSTMIAAKEYEKEYANTLYRLARENGTVFPATTFLWIHHNTKDGTKFRGSDALRNAVHETWELKELTDEQRAEFGDNALILEIDKSRGMRGGDRFLIKEDIEEALSLEDLTPTVTKGNGGTGDDTPRTIVLGVLKESQEALTVQEIRYELNSRLLGRRGPGNSVSQRTIERWLKHWVSTGLVETTSVRRPGPKGGKPATCYQVVALIYQANDVANPPDFFQTHSPARDEVCDTVLSQTLGDANSAGESPEVAAETDDTAEAPPEHGKGVTEMAEEPPAGASEQVSDTSSAKTTMSQTSEAETLSGTGVSGNPGEVCDTVSLVKEIDPPAALIDDWDPRNFS